MTEAEPKKLGGKRAGAGRKPRTPGVQTVIVSARVEPDLKAFAQKQPEGEGAFIRSLLLRAEIDSRIF